MLGVPVGGIVFLFVMVVVLIIGARWRKPPTTEPDPYPAGIDPLEEPDFDPVTDAPANQTEAPSRGRT